MNINRFLAKSIGLLNAALAVFLILFGTAAGISAFGPFGILFGPVAGLALAVMVCGLIALLIDIRDLLAESLDQQRTQGRNPD